MPGHLETLESFQQLKADLEAHTQSRCFDAALSVLALTRTIVCYSDFAPLVGYHHRDNKLWKALGVAMATDKSSGRPLRCSLVVNKSAGLPGASYFFEARRLGFEIDTIEEAELLFWLDQLVALGVEPPSWSLAQMAQYLSPGSTTVKAPPWAGKIMKEYLRDRQATTTG